MESVFVRRNAQDIVFRQPWACPFCGKVATIGDTDVSAQALASATGIRLVAVETVTCPDPDCGEVAVAARVAIRRRERALWATESIALQRRLIPGTAAQVWPDYVPEAIREDYQEACAIITDSPKAAATLARRCLQGMIRHFWQVSGKRSLKDEIDAIESLVDPLTWQAIDATRHVGNIGAHMERDVDLIIDVGPGDT